MLNSEAVYKDTTKKQNTQNQITRNVLNQQNIMLSEDDKNRIDELLEIINNPNKQNTQNARFEDNVNENFEDLTKRDKNKNKQQYDQYHQLDENESDSMYRFFMSYQGLPSRGRAAADADLRA